MTPERKEAWRVFATAWLLRYGSAKLPPGVCWRDDKELLGMWPYKDDAPGAAAPDETRIVDRLFDATQLTAFGLKFIRGEEDDA